MNAVLARRAGARGRHAGVVGDRRRCPARAMQRGDLVGVLARAAVHDRRARARDRSSTCISAARLRATAPLPSTLTTSKVRFGRSKPERIDTQSRRPSRAAISSATRGVAVAVAAITARAAERGDRVVQAQVVGAEVVPPLGHAVRLVDDEQRHAPARERRAEGAARRSARAPPARAASRPPRSRAAPARCGRPAIPDASIVARTPASRSRRHWSAISAISGLTTTTRPAPARSRAPAAGSTATCRRRSASRPGCRGPSSAACTASRWPGLNSCRPKRASSCSGVGTAQQTLGASWARSPASIGGGVSVVACTPPHATPRCGWRPLESSAASALRRHTTRAPRDGHERDRAPARPARRGATRQPSGARGSSSASIVRRITFISSCANDAPMQRRMPPPNGIHENVSRRPRPRGSARAGTRADRS